MENYSGDLADVVRAAASSAAELSDWPFIPSSDPVSYTPDQADRDFGDPFTFTGDPLLQDSDPHVVTGFLYNPGDLDPETGQTSLTDDSCRKQVDDHDKIAKTPSANVFSTMLQIPPDDEKLPAVEPAAAVGRPRLSKVPAAVFLSNTDSYNHSKNSNGNNHTLISLGASGMQISSPRNTGIKRRKCQAKKVVCIPATGPANSRASGEVVPSDLWAWRKYGQKPIKGSPYPRGYYRCSSSKGCSARKQVERSRADPNMLVITYTSEHNHPWPTQRNALAGSTRSQSTKISATKPGPIQSGPLKETSSPAEPKPDDKREATVHLLESNNDWSMSLAAEEADHDGGFLGPTPGFSEDSFLSDLGEIEAEPFEELFARGFGGDGGRRSKDLDSFEFYDWAADESHLEAAAAGGCSASTSGGDDNMADS